MRTLEVGPLAWLVELDGDVDPARYAASVRAARRDDIAAVVPAARTVLVTLHPGASRTEVESWLRGVEPTSSRHTGAGIVEIPVVYDGEDLDDISAATGLTVAEVIERHAAATYRCAFCGFAPGFAYLRGLDESLHLPRRPSPRTRVPAGSVAIAAEYGAVYPSASPGGWHLLGRTNAPMWRTARRPPALVGPGSAVRFVPVTP